jgi:CMP-N,N'-diacetyllegionaminic acid synthase
MNVLGLITARGGSKGIPGKNIAPCGGKPLLAWTCEASIGAKTITRAIVSTDDPAIAEVARAHGVEVPFMRPAELASDAARSIGVAQHAIAALAETGWHTDVLVLLQPTSPLRTARHVDEAFTLLGPDDDAVVSVMHVPHRFAPWSVLERDGDHLRDYVKGDLGFARDRRQGQPGLLARNGPALVVTRAHVIAAGSFYGERCAAYEMSNEDSIDIDDKFDLELADWRLRRRSSH